MVIWVILSLSCIAGILFRLGGISKEDCAKLFPKIPLWLANRWTRDLGVPLIYLIAFLTLHLKVSILTPLSLLALFGALTTYNKWFGIWLFKRPKSDVYPEDWAITGLLYGLSALFWGWGFILRTVLLVLGITFFSVKIDDVNLEEFVRGFLIISTIPLLLF